MIDTINNYFLDFAINHNSLLHGFRGRNSFFTGDIDTISLSDPNLIYPIMVCGFNPTGLERVNSVFTFSENIGNYRNISFVVGLLHEVEDVNDPISNNITIKMLEAVGLDVVKKVFDDRENGMCDKKAFLQFMDDNVRMYGPNIIGARKMISLSIAFTFKMRF